MALEIYTNGDMAFMEAILTGMGHVYNDGFLGQIFAMALLANAIMSLLKFISDSKNGFMTSFWQAIVLYLVMFSGTTQVNLTKIGEGTRPIPGDFPVGVIAPAYFISLVGNKIADRMRQNIVAIETGWGTSSNTAILDYGLGPLETLMAVRNQAVSGSFDKSEVISDVSNPDAGGSGLSKSIGNYYSYCVEKAVKLSEMDPEGIKYTRNILFAKVSKDYWSKLKIDEAWPVEIDLDGNFQTVTCSTAHGLIDDKLKTLAENEIKQKLYTLSQSNSNTNLSDEYDKLKDFYEAIDPIGGAQAISKLSANSYVALMSEGACKDSVLMGPSYVQACAAQWDSIQNRRVQEASKAESFLEMFAPMVTFIEGFVFVISPFMIILVLFTGAGGLKMMGKYFAALLWVALMPVCQVAVDVYLNTYFNRFLYSINADVAGTNFVSVQAQESVWTQLESFIAFAGTAQAMVPSLAMFIIFAGVHTMQGMGAGMAAGAAVDGSKLHANKSVGVKDGSFSYGQTSVQEARNEYGTQVGGEAVRAHSSNLDAGASNFKMGINTGEQHTQKVAASKNYADALKVDAGSKAATAFNEAWNDKTGFDTKQAASTGVSKAAALDMAYADILQDTFKIDQAASQTLARELRMGAGGSISASSGLDILGNGVKLAMQAETGMSAKDLEQFNAKLEDGTSLQEAFNKMTKATEQVNQDYSSVAGSGESNSHDMSYKEEESAYFQANAAHQRQVSHTEQIEEARSTTISKSLDDGGYSAAAGATQQGMISAVNAMGVEQYRNDMVNTITKGEVSDLNDLRKMSPDQLNSYMDNLTSGKPEGFSKDLSVMGVSKGEDGNWSVDSNNKYSAKMAGLTDENGQGNEAEFNNRMNPGRTVDSAADRAKMISNMLENFDKNRAELSLDHDKEAMQAAGDVYERAANAGSGSIQGVDQNLVHGGLLNYADQYKQAANDMVDVSTGYDKMLNDSGLDKSNEVGTAAAERQIESGQLTDHMGNATGNGIAAMEEKGKQVKASYQDADQRVSDTIIASLTGLRPELSGASQEEIEAGLRGETQSRYDNSVAQHDQAGSDAQKVKDTVAEQLQIQKGKADVEKTKLANEVTETLGDDKNAAVNYTPEQLALSQKLGHELNELHESAKYFDSDEAKASFQGMNEEQIGKFQDYIQGGETTLEEATQAFEGQYLDENKKDLTAALSRIRENHDNIDAIESEAKNVFEGDGVTGVYQGANYLANNEHMLDKSKPFASIGNDAMDRDGKVNPSAIKDIDGLGELSAKDHLDAVEYRAKRGIGEAFGASKENVKEAIGFFDRFRLDK